MTQILLFIATHMGYLWAGARFRIVGSEVATSNGGDAFLVVESTNLRMRFVQDRRELSVDFQSAVDEKGHWYSVDLIRRLYTGQPEKSSILDESYARFLEDHLDEIDELFGPQKWLDTQSALHKVRAQRSKEMWG